MNNNKHLLISLEDRYAQQIFAGTKRVELRRREMHVDAGDTVWIYVKVPVGSVTGYAVIEDTHSMSPASLWRRFGSWSGIDKADFDAYFKGVSTAFALELRDASILPNPVPLETLRKVSTGFQPPQFFVRVETGGALLKSMTAAKQIGRRVLRTPALLSSSPTAAYA